MGEVNVYCNCQLFHEFAVKLLRRGQLHTWHYLANLGEMSRKYYTDFYYYNNRLYKNTEAQFAKKNKNTSRTCSASDEKLK